MNEPSLPPGVVSSPDPVAASPVDARQQEQQRAFLLQQLEQAANHRLSQGAANKLITKAISTELDLSKAAASALRKELVTESYVRTERKNRTDFFELTDQGREYLKTLAPYLPPPARSRGEIKPASNDDIARWRKAYLLLQLLQANRTAATEGEANKLIRSTLGRETLELNTATARHLRHQLAGEGLIAVTSGGRSESYTLTVAGRAHLGTLDFPTKSRHVLKGEILNQLLEAARESAKQFEALGMTATARPIAASPVDLADTVRCEFEDLRREKYQLSGMVPIYEVRQRMRAKYGDQSARADVFDDAVKALWRNGLVKLAPLADLGRATQEQLRDSIPGVGETVFYLEAAHETAVL